LDLFSLFQTPGFSLMLGLVAQEDRKSEVRDQKSAVRVSE